MAIRTTKKERPLEVEHIGDKIHVRSNIRQVEEPAEGNRPARKGWDYDEKIYTKTEYDILMLQLAFVESERG